MYHFCVSKQKKNNNIKRIHLDIQATAMSLSQASSNLHYLIKETGHVQLNKN